MAFRRGKMHMQKRGGGGSLDEFTSALYQFDSDLNDASEHGIDLVANGDAGSDGSQKKFGAGSLALDGSGDFVSLAAPLPAELVFGTGDWTIDYLIYYNVVAANGGLWDIGGYQTGVYARQLSTSAIDFFIGNVRYNVYSWTPSIETWYHHELSREGSNLRFFVDGTQVGSTQSISADLTCTGALEIGRIDGSNARCLDGKFDEFHISKGIARHTSNFTPPTGPYV